jgi:hypothetical protein
MKLNFNLIFPKIVVFEYSRRLWITESDTMVLVHKNSKQSGQSPSICAFFVFWAINMVSEI